MLKGVPDYDKKSKDYNFLWIMEELKKTTAGVDIKTNRRLYLIEHLILLVTLRQVPNEMNDEYLDRFNARIKN